MVLFMYDQWYLVQVCGYVIRVGGEVIEGYYGMWLVFVDDYVGCVQCVYQLLWCCQQCQFVFVVQVGDCQCVDGDVVLWYQVGFYCVFGVYLGDWYVVFVQYVGYGQVGEDVIVGVIGQDYYWVFFFVGCIYDSFLKVGLMCDCRWLVLCVVFVVVVVVGLVFIGMLVVVGVVVVFIGLVVVFLVLLMCMVW